jgi:hypothetical protein
LRLLAFHGLALGRFALGRLALCRRCAVARCTESRSIESRTAAAFDAGAATGGGATGAAATAAADTGAIAVTPRQRVRRSSDCMRSSTALVGALRCTTSSAPQARGRSFSSNHALASQKCARA